MSSKATTTSQMGQRPPTDVQRFTDKLVIRDDSPIQLGNDGDVEVQFNATRGIAEVLPEGQAVEIRGLNQAADRIMLEERFLQIPQLNASIANDTANKNFEILGTNASDDDVTFNAEGGIKLETDGADGDQVIVLPHLDAGQTAWTGTTWGTDQQVRWECALRTGASIADVIIWAGLKLTNTSVTATDNDQAFFRFEDSVNSGKFQAINSIGGTDDADDSGVTVAADTNYHLVIEIDSSRVAKFYINGVLVATSAALTNTTDLIPYIGVEGDVAATAKSIIVRHCGISRVAA